MNTIDDQTYIDRIKNGDPSAYSFLINKYKDMAYTISLKITRNTQDAEDATQESFIKAYDAIHSFKGNAKFSTWLYTIVYRTSLYLVKTRKKGIVPISDELTAHYRPDDQIPQIDQIQSIERRKYILQAIHELSPTESLLITLYYLNESPIKEITAITGLSIPNVKIQLFRARKKLERKLNFLS